MAENAPPTTAANGASDAARGMPYYEKLKRDLRESLAKKRAIDNQLAQIEESILRAETAYLEETSAGNIVKGFDNYIKGAATTSTTGGAGTATRRKATISDVDRIFSRSSSSFMRDGASTPGGSAQTTPSHAPTPSSTFLQRESSQPTPNGAPKNGTATKKKRTPEEEDADGKPVKRGKITYSRDEK